MFLASGRIEDETLGARAAARRSVKGTIARHATNPINTRNGGPVDDPIEDEDEDLYDYQPPPGPSPREVRRRWVEEGNVEAFLNLIRDKPWSSISIGEQLQNLMAACRVGAKADPEGFS